MIYKFKIYNPFLIYTVTWVSVLLLYSLGLTNNLLEIDSKTIYLILNSILSFGFIFLITFFILLFKEGKSSNGKHSRKFYLYDNLDVFKGILKNMLYIWIFFTAVEIILFGGLPFIAVVIQGNYDLNYTTFGIPTLHGLLNSLYLITTTGFFLHFKLSKDQVSKKLVLLLFVWPFLVMSRGVLLWVSIEMLYIYLLFSKVSLKKLSSVALGGVFFIIVFGYIGDNRGEKQEVRFTDQFILDEYAEIGEKIPSGLVWAYLYATTPINNLVYNSDVTPSYGFKNSFKALVPSFIRDKIYKDDGKSLELYSDSFNVSSVFANFLKDFGHFGANVLVAVLQIIVTMIYLSSKRMKIGSILCYSAIFYAIVTTVFFDNFLSLVTISQIALGLYINRLLYNK